MPAGLIKEDNGVRSEGDFGCDLVEMELHGFAVASRQHEGGAGSTFGTDRTKTDKSIGPKAWGLPVIGKIRWSGGLCYLSAPPGTASTGRSAVLRYNAMPSCRRSGPGHSSEPRPRG